MTRETRPGNPTREMAPCKDCQRRAPACHGTCDRYKDWRKRLDELNRARKEYSFKATVYLLK